MKKGRGIVSTVKHGLRALFVIGLVIGAGVIAQMAGPDPYIFENGDWDDMNYTPYHNASQWSVLLDGHSHTTNSDGRLTPEQNIQWHIAHGFNAAVITDHGSILGALETREIARSRYNDSIKILVGLEWTTYRVHMNIIGISEAFIDHFSHEDYRRSVPTDASDEEIKNVIQQAHDLDGVVVVNHYPRFKRDKPSREQLYAWGVDYFEVLNDKNNGRSVYDDESYNFSEQHGLGVLTGSDMHDPTRMRVHGWTLLDPAEFTESSIFDELKTKRTGILYDYTGVPYAVDHTSNPWYTALKPLVAVGDMFLSYSNWPSIDWLAMGLLIGYLEGGYAVVGIINIRSKDRKKGRSHS